MAGFVVARPVAARTAALLAGLALVAGCTGPVAPAESEPAESAPTSSSTGGDAPLDPYYPDVGDPDYQVAHYDLAVRYDPDSRELTGRATVTAVAVAPLPQLRLDLTGLTVRSAALDGDPAQTDRTDGKLVVTPTDPVAAGAEFTVTVDYHGVPEPVSQSALARNGFQHHDGGAFVIGQPRSASTWFPVNDHPRDKATYTIDITVPDGLAAVSNGVPDGQRPAGDGWTSWRWHERHPMASYLATLAIGDYRVSEREHRGRPLVTAVHADLPRDVDAQLLDTGEIADTLEQWFGPYPFDAYGGIAVADPQVRSALETQSRPIYGPAFFEDGRDGTGVIVHETAHQWFGNSVSVESWRDIWLNEGFATYAEWLFDEHDGGDTAQETFDLYWDGPGAESGFWSPPPGDPGPDQLLSSPVYVRGAMALHALRRTVGDDVFFEILRTWPDRHEYGNASTGDLVELSEQVSGQPLEPLFDAWLYATDRPDYPGA